MSDEVDFLHADKHQSFLQVDTISNKAKFSKKTNISYPLIFTCTYAYHGVKKCLFFGKFAI